MAIQQLRVIEGSPTSKLILFGDNNKMEIDIHNGKHLTLTKDELGQVLLTYQEADHLMGIGAVTLDDMLNHIDRTFVNKALHPSTHKHCTAAGGCDG